MGIISGRRDRGIDLPRVAPAFTVEVDSCGPKLSVGLGEPQSDYMVLGPFAGC